MSYLAFLLRSALLGVRSQGQRLAQIRGAVSLEASSETEASLRVRATGLEAAAEVTLYFESEEWTCDCGGKMDPCNHIVAAAVWFFERSAQAAQAPSVGAVSDEESAPSSRDGARSERPLSPSKALRHGTPPSSLDSSAPLASSAITPRRRLGYRWSRDATGLGLSRVIVAPDGSETPLRQSLHLPTLAALVRELAPRREDLNLDRLLGSALGRYRPGPTLLAVLTTLAGADDVRFEGRPAKVSTEPLLPEGRIVDDGSGFILHLAASPELSEVLAPGLGRSGDVLRPLGEMELAGARFERLPSQRRFRREQGAELAGRVLPELEHRFVVHVLTQRLPNRVRTLKPRVAFAIAEAEGVWSVVAQLVYGEPAVARVEKGELLSLGGPAPKRDHDAENTLALSLKDELGLLLERPLRSSGADGAHFIARLRQWQQRNGGVESGETKRGSAPRQLSAQLVWEQEVLHCSFVTDEGTSHALASDNSAAARAAHGAQQSVSAVLVLRAYHEGLQQLPLANGGWAALPTDWLSRHGAWLGELLLARRGDGTVPRAARLALCGDAQSPGVVSPAELDAMARFAAARQQEVDSPNALSATLRPYQRQGVGWLLSLAEQGVGGILADDMGLGKTLQTLAVLSGQSLIVCPRSLVHNWASECARFRPGLKLTRYEGGERGPVGEHEITLTTYGVLRQHLDKLTAVNWDWIVLDEAQAIKNPDSLTAQAAFELKGRTRLALTGTPIENRLEDLWSEMQFANPGLLGSRARFKERFSSVDGSAQVEAGARLRRLILPFVLRRLKRDVVPELPPRTDDILWVEFEPAERQVYEALLQGAQRELSAELAKGTTSLAVLEALLRLRQAACHVGLLPGRTEARSSKTELLIESLVELVAGGQKALVFSQWTSLLDRVEPLLRERDLPFLRLDGKTKDRASVVADFQSSSGAPILLASLKAGGTGLNLTAADHVFLCDPWWNPATESQAADRAHRIGRDRPVLVHRLVTKDTVEERVLQLQERKRALGGVVDGGELEASLTTAEWRELLENG